MRVKYSSTLTGKESVVETSAETFYADIAKKMAAEEHGRGNVTVESDDGVVVYSVGIRSGTQVINELKNTLPPNYSDRYTERYLTCIIPEKNAYKFYHMLPCGDEFKASYGRMGTVKGEKFGERSCMYPISCFWVKYYEKVGKGYVDNSGVYISNDQNQSPPEAVNRTQVSRKKTMSASAKLYELLLSMAKHAVREAKVKVPITPAIIEASKRLLDEMRQTKDANAFNKSLLQLMAILQRPVPTGDGMGVRNALAQVERDIPRIIEREEDLVTAMEGTLTGVKEPSGDFSDFGIEVYAATEKQKTEALKTLSPSLRSMVANVYRVIPKRQNERFNAYLLKNHITAVKQLWHGSRNENWMSIVRNSLVLNPNAVITGKMFGHGIYFAPSSMKSWGYTSNGKWTGTTSRKSIMGLYAVAYGKPYNVEEWRLNAKWKEEMENAGCNSLHAHEGKDLRADEIIVYDEAAIVLNYLVEFNC